EPVTAPVESLATSLHLPDIAEHSEVHVPASPAPMLPEFDLNAINLDLDEPDIAADTGVDPYTAEMSTKLDLALAYREIGDKEGARELLDEVVKGGSTAQVEKARSILLELA
ncbi:MAG: FimV/HubP family polar landmark protein, partial [Herbaspirillum sp.]